MSDTGTLKVLSLRERAAEEIRALLARRRLSASELARQMGVSQAYVWRRLSGETAFDLDDLERIADLLQVDAGDLMPRRSRSEPGRELRRSDYDRPTKRAGSLRPNGRTDHRGPRRTSRVNRPAPADFTRPPMAQSRRAA